MPNPLKLMMGTAGVSGGSELWVAGENSRGQLGQGNVILRSSPVQIGEKEWFSASMSNDFGTGIKSDYTLWSWGYNSRGALAQGNVVYTSSPVQIGSSSNWAKISLGASSSSFAINDSGKLYAWGGGAHGALGLGATINVSVATQVGSLTNWSKSYVGPGETSAAIKTDGTLWMWGQGGSGRLGQGTTISHSSPVQVGSLTNWSKLFVQNGFVAAIKTDGTLWAWGSNNVGALGDGTIIDKSSPIQIGARTDWVSVGGGQGWTHGVTSDGKMWSWGRGLSGRLAQGTTISHSSPTQIGALTTWTIVSKGSRYQGFAIKSDGTLWSWGRNNKGQTAQGTIIDSSSPVQVGSDTDWTFASHTAYNALFLK